MQTLFKGNEFTLYRDTEHTYLKNGTVKQIETGQCNSLLTKLHGLTDEQAENLIKSEYEGGMIKVIEELDRSTFETHGRRFIDTNIYQKIYKGELMPAYLVKVRKDGKVFQKSFNTLDESRKYRDEIKGFIQPEPADKLVKNELIREYAEPSIGKCIKGKWIRYRVRVYRNGRTYYTLTNTIEEARAFRDNVLNNVKKIRRGINDLQTKRLP